MHNVIFLLQRMQLTSALSPVTVPIVGSLGVVLVPDGIISVWV